MTNLDKLFLRQLALDLEKSLVMLDGTPKPEDRECVFAASFVRGVSVELRRIAGEPAERAGHRAECPSLLLTNPGKCNCEAPYGAGGL